MPEHLGQQQPGLRGAVGNPGVDERRKRRFQMRARGWNIGRRERVPEQALAMRDDEVAVVDGAQRDKGASPFDGRAALVQRDLCLAEQLDHRGDIEPVQAGRGEPPPQHSRRHRRLALCQVHRGDRRCGFLTALDAAQHPGSILDSPLREPELGERPGRERMRRREHAPRHGDRIGEKRLGGAPVAVSNSTRP